LRQYFRHVGAIDIEVIADLQEKSVMTPDDVQIYVVGHQHAFGDIVLQKFVSTPQAFAAVPGAPHIVKAELQLKDWDLFSRPFLMPDLGPPH
jgi:hypothetical protein